MNHGFRAKNADIHKNINERMLLISKKIDKTALVRMFNLRILNNEIFLGEIAVRFVLYCEIIKEPVANKSL